jgi:hypothetical protein
MAFRSQSYAGDDHFRGVIPAHRVNGEGIGDRGGIGRRGRHHHGRRGSDPDRAFERLARTHNFTAVIVTAVAADMMGALQLTTVTALGVSLGRDRVMATAHPLAGRRGLSFGNGHCRNPFRFA